VPVLLAANAFEKGAATFLFVLIVVGLVFGGYKLFERFGQRRDN